MQRLPVHTVQRDGDQIGILTDTGVTLLDGSVHELQFQPSEGVAPDMAYTPGGGGLSGLFVGTLDITPGSGAPQAPASGTLASNFSVRDQAMPQAQKQLDEIASVLASSLQAADASVTDPTTQGGIFLDGTAPHDRTETASITGLAGRIALNPLVDPDKGGETWRLRTGLYAAGPGDPGEGSQARAFTAVFDTEQNFDAAAGLGARDRLVDWANRMTATQAAAKTDLDSQMGYQQSLVSSLDARLSDKQGVDLDKELGDALLFEKTYAASATVLQTAAQMLDTLLEKL
jgi:flagellar hook-associated protein 1 FlgK